MGSKRETRGSHLGDCYGQRGLGVARRRDGADDGALLKFGGDWDSVTAGREQSGGLCSFAGTMQSLARGCK